MKKLLLAFCLLASCEDGQKSVVVPQPIPEPIPQPIPEPVPQPIPEPVPQPIQWVKSGITHNGYARCIKVGGCKTFAVTDGLPKFNASITTPLVMIPQGEIRIISLDTWGNSNRLHLHLFFKIDGSADFYSPPEEWEGVELSGHQDDNGIERIAR